MRLWEKTKKVSAERDIKKLERMVAMLCDKILRQLLIF